MNDHKVINECIDELEKLINQRKTSKAYQYQSLEYNQKSNLIINSEQQIKARLKTIQNKLKNITKS